MLPYHAILRKSCEIGIYGPLYFCVWHLLCQFSCSLLFPTQLPVSISILLCFFAQHSEFYCQPDQTALVFTTVFVFGVGRSCNCYCECSSAWRQYVAELFSLFPFSFPFPCLCFSSFLFPLPPPPFFFLSHSFFHF